MGLLLYALIGSVLFILQDHLLFHPKAVEADSSYRFKQPYQESTIPLDAKTQFHVVHFTVPDSLRKGVVLYFHGNQKNIGRYVPYAEIFTRNNYEVWMIDYPKFGKSTGELTEENLYEGALQLYMLAKIRFKPEQIIIYGFQVRRDHSVPDYPVFLHLPTLRFQKQMIYWIGKERKFHTACYWTDNE